MRITRWLVMFMFVGVAIKGSAPLFLVDKNITQKNNPAPNPASKGAILKELMEKFKQRQETTISPLEQFDTDLSALTHALPAPDTSSKTPAQKYFEKLRLGGELENLPSSQSGSIATILGRLPEGRIKKTPYNVEYKFKTKTCTYAIGDSDDEDAEKKDVYIGENASKDKLVLYYIDEDIIRITKKDYGKVSCTGLILNTSFIDLQESTPATKPTTAPGPVFDAQTFLDDMVKEGRAKKYSNYENLYGFKTGVVSYQQPKGKNEPIYMTKTSDEKIVLYHSTKLVQIMHADYGNIQWGGVVLDKAHIELTKKIPAPRPTTK